MYNWNEMNDRERDALVNEKIFSRNVYQLYNDGGKLEWYERIRFGDLDGYQPIEHYTTDISAAWKVVMKMRSDVWDMDFHIVRDACECQFIRPTVNSVMTVESTATETICLAALRSVGIDI